LKKQIRHEITKHNKIKTMTSFNIKNKETINRFQMLVLFFLTAIFFINFTIRIIISPLLPTISLDMGLSHDQGGSLFAAGIAFILTGLSQGLLGMRIGIFCVGMASALYLPSGMAILTSSIDQGNWGKAIGIHELAPNLSFLLAPLISEVLLLLLPWRSLFFIIGGLSIIMGALFLDHGCSVQPWRYRDSGSVFHAAAVPG